jgi:hypothetical protein
MNRSYSLGTSERGVMISDKLGRIVQLDWDEALTIAETILSAARHPSRSLNLGRDENGDRR